MKKEMMTNTLNVPNVDIMIVHNNNNNEGYIILLNYNYGCINGFIISILHLVKVEIILTTIYSAGELNL